MQPVNNKYNTMGENADQLRPRRDSGGGGETGRWTSNDGKSSFEAAVDAAASTTSRLSPSGSFPYLQEAVSALSPPVSSHDVSASAGAAADPPRAHRLAAFLKHNAVQRCLSATVLAPLVTFFIWQSPAFATATVCSFVTSACSYEFACMAHRIQHRLLASFDAFESAVAHCQSPLCEESATSHHSSRSDDSGDSDDSDTGDADADAPRSRSSNFRLGESPSSALRGRASFQHTDAGQNPSAAHFSDECTGDVGNTGDFGGIEELQLRQKCAVTGIGNRFFGGREWLAAVALSTLLSAVTSVIFLSSARLIPELQSTEFYQSRFFYTIATDFVAALCACYTPNWRYAVVCFVESAVFTILTMHSTICPINQFSCGLSLEPAQVFLSGAIIVMLFRFTTSRTRAHAFINFMLDLIGYVYIIGSLSVLVAFVDDDKKTLYRKLLIALLYVVWASDTGAYLTGKLLVSLKYPYYNPLAAHLSKNKDYEGTVGAILFGIAAMMLSSHLLSVPGSTGTKIAFTVLGVVVGRLGDLFESLLKRAACVKDSGKLIPGHGGVLDRIDALMFAALVFARYYALVIGVD